jgi:C4-dicarboxylate transporter, DctM subunit
MIHTGFVVVLILLTSLASGMWVMMSMLLTGTLSLTLFRDMPIARLMAQNLWNTATSESLLVLPLFILMAEILFRSRLSQNLFTGLAPWTARLPGRLLHVNVLGCTLFAATCGSSAATTATIGRITYGELTGRGYDRRIVIGSLAGAGTLGLLIPPSTIMIVYGVLSDTSILALFLSGFVPGLLLAFCFMVYIAIRTTLAPRLLPERVDHYGTRDRLRGLVEIAPVVLLVTAVIGSLYSGIASPIETAVLGVVGALVIALSQRALGWRTLLDALVAAANTTSMLGLITAAAVFLSVALGFLGIPRQVAQAIVGLGLDPLVLIALLVVVYMLLGCFLDGISMIVMTVPIVLPIVTAAGYHPVWFGIFLVLVVEMAQITPPIGFNLFVIQGLTGERLVRIALDTLPFFLILAAFAMLIAFVPELGMLGVRGPRAG